MTLKEVISDLCASLLVKDSNRKILDSPSKAKISWLGSKPGKSECPLSSEAHGKEPDLAGAEAQR